MHFKHAILTTTFSAADTDPHQRKGEFDMNAISGRFSVLGVLALAATLVAAAPGLANAGHILYPPGWDKPRATGPVLYQMAPAGERYHVVKPATTATDTTK
jgi:hypothetical protein